MWKSKTRLGVASLGAARQGPAWRVTAVHGVGFKSVGCVMLVAGNQVRCLYELDSDRTLQVGVLYTIEVGQSDDSAMISLVGFEGAFLASRFELISKSSADETIPVKREQLVAKCVEQCLPRVAAAAMCAMKKLQLIIDGAKRITNDTEAAERCEHMPERLAGVELASDWTIELVGVDAVCERVAAGSQFDLEQIEHDVKVKLKQVLREL
jgi:hypothetical protein